MNPECVPRSPSGSPRASRSSPPARVSSSSPATWNPVPGGRDPTPIPALDIELRRNDYGRQRESFEAPVEFDGLDSTPFPGVFIRAPRILRLGAEVTSIARRGDEVVGVKSGAIWGLTFHPELSGDTRVHERFLRDAVGWGHPR